MSTIRCINLGSGQRPFTTEGDHFWLNVDINPKWNPDMVADGAKLDQIGDASQDIIVSHHNIEHFGLGEADSTLRECFRVLKPGGKLIITTPDLHALCMAWIASKIDNYTFCVNLYGAYQDNEADRHKWLYTKETLINSVKSTAPWTSVGPFNWSEIPGSSIAKDWWILGVSAIK